MTGEHWNVVGSGLFLTGILLIGHGMLLRSPQLVRAGCLLAFHYGQIAYFICRMMLAKRTGAFG